MGEHTCIDCGDSCDCGEEAIDCLACSVCTEPPDWIEDDGLGVEEDWDDDLPADDDPL